MMTRYGTGRHAFSIRKTGLVSNKNGKKANFGKNLFHQWTRNN
jgi:hypothetical protein